jgi:gamma-glutamyltranspeptidase
VTCVMCDVATEVSASHPFCAACGWPLPDRGGHAVDAVVRWAGEVPA